MTNIIFEQSRKLDDQYQEYWTARQLARDLEYAEYRNFLPVIEKAKMACANS
jgi:DNA-damage-inducible protein D